MPKNKNKNKSQVDKQKQNKTKIRWTNKNDKKCQKKHITDAQIKTKTKV